MLATLILAATTLALAEHPHPADHAQSFSAPRATSTPLPSTLLTDSAWKSALEIPLAENFVTRAPAALKTTAYLMYDDKNVYVAAHAEQSGVPIVAVQTVDHAGISADDHISVAIDTSGNGSRVYTFRVSPSGIHDEASSENARYAPDWKTYAKVTENGDYDALLIIPFANLHLQPGTQSWRVNITRYVAKTGDLFEWAYEPNQSDPTSPQYWPTIKGITVSSGASKPQPHADVYALGAGGSDHERFQSTFGSFHTMKARTVGADFTYPLTGTLSVVGTINPDFSNVEKDQTTTAPQQFARNYSEYRPFFAQGARYINSLPSVTVNGITESLFYTPSIGVFDRGLKLEGTAGNHSIGLLNASGQGFNDTAMGYAYSNADQTLRISGEGVFARHADLRDNSYGIGVRRTNARSGAFTIAKAEMENSSDTGTSHYLFASEGLQTATWFTAIDYRDVSANFNPADGYTAFTDIRGPRLGFNYNGVTPKGSFVKNWSVGGWLDRFVDHTGAPKEYDANFGLYAQLSNQFSLQLNGGTSALRFDDNPKAPFTPFNLRQIQLGYGDTSPTPIDVGYSWGPFGAGFLQQATFSTSQAFGPYSLTAEYDGTVERNAGPRDSQWLRRVSIARSFGKDASFAISLRSINGNGGYAVPGTNLSFAFHKRMPNADELYFDFGTPASRSTLHRFIGKYVFHVGGGTNT